MVVVVVREEAEEEHFLRHWRAKVVNRNRRYELGKEGYGRWVGWR